MESFGQKVRLAVESQGLRLDDVAQATGLHVEQIQALAQDDFGSLPSDGSVEEALRSFARLVEVDPDEVIADYHRERLRWVAPPPHETGVAPSRDASGDLDDHESAPGSPELLLKLRQLWARSGRTARAAIVASALLALVLGAFLFWPRSSATPEPSRRGASRDAAPKTPGGKKTPDTLGAGTNRAVSRIDTPVRADDSRAARPAIERSTHAPRLSVLEHGTGRRVIHGELTGAAARFAEGERAWFWTRVEGATPGETIEHVWIHDGKEALRVPLILGAARWRTQSYKDLNPGSKGNWVVEARDETGRVLARGEFICSP